LRYNRQAVDLCPQLNPRGLVPTLGCPTPSGSKPLYESTIICEYLQDAYPNQDPNIFPKDPYDKARTKIWIDHVSSKIVPAWHKLLQHTSNSPYSLEDAKDGYKNQIKAWIKEADKEGPWWNGKDFTMADIVFAPWVMRQWVFEHFSKDPEIPEKGQGGEDKEVWDRWWKWVEAVKGRQSVTKLVSEREHYLPIYKRYAEDKAQSEMAKATREGKPPP
jgi:glutathione S-transferase